MEEATAAWWEAQASHKTTFDSTTQTGFGGGNTWTGAQVVPFNAAKTWEQEYEAIASWFAAPRRLRTLDQRQTRTVNKGHGRLETRVLTATTELNHDLDWPDGPQVLMLEKTVVDLKTGEISLVQRYAVTSLPPTQADPRRLLALWRGHWSIENGLHSPPGCLPEIMAICRNAILNLLHAWGYVSLKLARECFSLNPFKALGLLELPVSFSFQ